MELLRKLEQKENFTERECEIADYILRNCESVLKMTTRELASETFTSATVIVRFVKKIGYDGFQDFKLHLLVDLKESQFERVEVERKEHILSLMNKISSLHEKSLFETKEMLSTETLEKIQAAFQKYNVVDFFGFDANRAIGEYDSHNFIQAGVSSNVYAAVDKILLYEYYVERSVVIVISRMGTVHISAAHCATFEKKIILSFASQATVKLRLQNMRMPCCCAPTKKMSFNLGTQCSTPRYPISSTCLFPFCCATTMTAHCNSISDMVNFSLNNTN